MPESDRYAQRIEAGVCSACGRRKPRPGRTKCAQCAQAIVENNRDRREVLQARGLCDLCGERPARGERRTCAECGAYYVASNADYRARI